MSRGVATDGFYGMIWREAHWLEDQTNEA